MLTTRNPFISRLFAALQDEGVEVEVLMELTNAMGGRLKLAICTVAQDSTNSFFILDQGEQGYSVFLPTTFLTVQEDARAIATALRL